ncbi:hypothetical protein ACCO45_008856 [Purpureocillium lilacinum]|uniref:Uncharacterized protein n=1 Tax=Purpureocillium lilacinum TaxID=33203 RepID=A0ACC4DHZ3_PURLI
MHFSEAPRVADDVCTGSEGTHGGVRAFATTKRRCDAVIALACRQRQVSSTIRPPSKNAWSRRLEYWGDWALERSHYATQCAIPRCVQTGLSDMPRASMSLGRKRRQKSRNLPLDPHLMAPGGGIAGLSPVPDRLRGRTVVQTLPPNGHSVHAWRKPRTWPRPMILQEWALAARHSGSTTDGNAETARICGRCTRGWKDPYRGGCANDGDGNAALPFPGLATMLKIGHFCTSDEGSNSLNSRGGRHGLIP